MGVFATAVSGVLALVACPPPGEPDVPTPATSAPVRKPGITVAPSTSGRKKVPRPSETALSKAKGLQLASGGAHSCLLRADETVACWGSNDAGQFGRDAFDGAVAAVPAAGFTGVLELAAGDRHTCGRKGSGEVICAGDDALGQLGMGAFDANLVTAMQPVKGLGSATAITAGAEHTCALKDAGRVACWGRGDRGQLGTGAPLTAEAGKTPHSREPLDVKGLDDVVEVRAGGDHTCARKRSGAVLCWGAGAAGQLGDGAKEDRGAPVAVTHATEAITIGVGPSHACALRDKVGSVVCWGDGSQGQLGGGAPSAGAAMMETRGLGDILELALTETSTCARTLTGEAVCWGNGDPKPRTVARGVMQISAGRKHVCGMRPKGGAVCWGDNGGGQLGEGFASVARGEPVIVQGLYDER